MNWYVKRVGQSLITLWTVVTLAFFLTRQMPGSLIDRYVSRMASNTGQSPQTIRDNIESQLMLDPDAGFFEAYVTYFSELLTGNLGTSFVAGDLNSLVAETVPWTLFVMTLATLGLFAISLSLGAVMAYKEGGVFDLSNTFVGIITTSVPYYVAGILLIIYVGFGEGIITQHFPVRYKKPEGVDVGFTIDFVVGAFQHATLPALSYIITGYGLMALTMRGNSIQVLGEDYVRVAELRGLPDRRIALRYVGRNAVLPLYTSLLISFGFMLGASIILEQIFTYKGIGYWMERGLRRLDVPLMMAVFMMISFSVILATFIADVTYGKLDPRIKTGDEGEAY